ncbi:MAG TPA: hypothetical protein VLX29_02885 [Nitrospirota bacterium]|nr:hypothetical protein [Nitrospirota bacterium]
MAILTIAYEKYRQDAAAYVSAREILVEHYGFPIKGKYVGAGRCAPIFDRREIGVKRYMSASVTVAQCFNRLTAKGLVERRYCYGIRLTGVGVRRVKEINKKCQKPVDNSFGNTQTCTHHQETEHSSIP